MNNDLSITSHNTIKQSAIVSTLKNYVEYLYDNKLVDNRLDAKQRVGEIMSPALDVGAITDNMLVEVCNYVDNRLAVVNTTRLREAGNVKLVSAIETLAHTTDEDELLNKYKALKQEQAELEQQLISKYGDLAIAYSNEFIDAYSKLFDTEFVEWNSKISKMI